MRCHYENVVGVGRFLIPGCWPVVISNDIDMCICHPTTYEGFERESYQKEVNRLKGIIEELEKENNFYADLLEKSGVTVIYDNKEEE